MTDVSRETAVRKAAPLARIKRILIVDDHPVVRRGLAELISHESDLGICGEAADASSAMELADSTKPDLAIIDISLRDMNGIELIKQLKARFPSLKMLVCSMHDEKLYAERALKAGAMGYITKERASDQIVDAIQIVLGGRMFLSETMAERLMHRAVGHAEEPSQSGVEMLTDRELEVFELLGQGCSTREVAGRLHLSVKTIDAHRQKIKSKLNLADSNQLIQHAVRWTMERS